MDEEAKDELREKAGMLRSLKGVPCVQPYISFSSPLFYNRFRLQPLS